MHQIVLQTIHWAAKVLPVGILYGSGLLLSSPTHLTVEIVTACVCVVFGSVAALCFTSILKAAKFHYIALLIALICMAHGTITYIGLPNLEDEESIIREVSSCLRQFATTTAFVSAALINFWSTPVRKLPENLAKSSFLLPDPDHKARQGVSTSWERHDCISDVDSVTFEHTGPVSTSSETTSSSDIYLSSQGPVPPAFAQNVVQLSINLAPIESKREASESIQPQPESEEAAK